MNKDSLLDLIFYIICVLIIFILKYLNKQRRVFTKLKVGNGNGDDSRTMHCIMNAKKCYFCMYPNKSAIYFRLSGDVDLKGPLSPDKTIIFFDDILFQIKYKTYILNYIYKCREQGMN